MQTKKAILLEEVSAKVFQAIEDSRSAWQAELVVYLWQAKADEIKRVWMDRCNDEKLISALSFYGSKMILDRPNNFGRVPIVLDVSN